MKFFLFILIFCVNLLGSERIVTLSPSINEIVFALGVGENVVANTTNNFYKKKLQKLLLIQLD